MMLATSTATKPKTEASVTEVPTVGDTSESVRYKVFIQKFPRLVEAVSPVVVKFAVNALSKSLISEYNKCQGENTTREEYDRASVLMSQILPKIKDSDAHFDAFVSILQELKMSKLACELKKSVDPTVKLPVTSSRTREDSDSGSTSEAESVDATGFQCPCGQCSLEKYFRDKSKCPGLQETSFPFLKQCHLNEFEKDTLEHQLIEDVNRIKREFQKLSDAVFEALEQNKTPVSKIRRTVFSSAEAGRPKPIQTIHGNELKAIATISDLNSFLISHKYISFINYRILEDIINKHCKECQTELDNYLQKFKEFSRRNVFEVPSDFFDSTSTLDQLLVVKVIDEMWFGAERDTPDCPFTLRDIKSVQNIIAEVIEHNHRFIHLIDVGKGCIQLAFEILSCQEAPIFPLTTSQLSELIRCGIIVLYQPNVPSLPTNIQDRDGQTHDIQFTVADDSETPPTVPSADDSETTPTIPSADDSKTPPIPSLFTTPPVQILSSIKPPVTRIFHSKFTDDDRSMASVDLGYFGSRASSLGYSGSRASSLGYFGSRASSLGYSGSRASSLGYSGSMASSLVELQEPRMDKKRHMYEGLPLEKLERRIARKKSYVELCKRGKVFLQREQREAEERVRGLQSRLAQTTDEYDQRELERKIHDGEEWIKECKEGMQRCEEWINRHKSALLSLYETKDKESKRLLDLGMTKTSPSLRTDTSHLKSSQELPLRHGTKPSRRAMTPPSYQPLTAAAVKPTAPSSEQSQLQTLSGKEELSLTMKPLERRIAEKKSWIEGWKHDKADYQQRQREAEEEVRVLQSRLAQTSDEDMRRELERKIHDGEEWIKMCKELVQYWEERINLAESDILTLTETKDKESKRLLGEETSMTSPSYQPVTVAAVKRTVPLSGHSQHQTFIELPPTLETKVDTVTLEDDV